MLLSLISSKQFFLKRLKLVCGITGIIVGLFLWLPVTFALGKVTIMVKNPDPYLGNHSRFIYEKEPGTALEDVALLKNIGDQPIVISLYAVDAMASEQGSFLLTFPDELQKGIGKWTTLEQKLVTINPGESIDVPFRITIPADAAPGQYLGGIVVEEVGVPNDAAVTESTSTTPCGVDKASCSQTISVRSRVGSRIYLTVPGEVIENVRVVDFTSSKSITGTTAFNFTVENKGNIAYEPRVTIEIYDQKGKLYEKLTGSLGTSLPGAAFNSTLKMKHRPLFGQFTARAYIQFERKFNSSQLHGSPLTETRSLNFWVMPWEILSLLAILVMGIFSIHWQQKRAYQKFINYSEDYVVQPQENLLLLAIKYRISWKKLAKYNDMKPPYILAPGQKIRVPKKS